MLMLCRRKMAYCPSVFLLCRPLQVLARREEALGSLRGVYKLPAAYRCVPFVCKAVPDTCLFVIHSVQINTFWQFDCKQTQTAQLVQHAR